MKSILGALLTMSLAQILWAQTTQMGRTESQSLKDRIANQLDRLHINVDERNSDLMAELQAKYGFTVRCDRGFAGMWGALDTDNCYLGLDSLNKALAQVDPMVERQDLRTVQIEVSDSGVWQGVSLTDRHIRIPYNAHPDRMAEFLNEQVRILFSTSVQDLEEQNLRTVEELRDNYFVNVVADPSLQTAKFHDGLQKMQLVAQHVFGNAEPSEEEAFRLGLDTIVVVLSEQYRPLYEDNGELRVNLDIEDRPGEMTNQLMEQIQPVHPKWREYVPFGAKPGYSWPEVQVFRENRRRVEDLSRWMQENYPNKSVECILDSSASHSIKLAECWTGLDNLQRALQKYAVNENQIRPQRILIGDPWIRRHYFIPEQDAIFIGYNMNEDSMFEAVTSQ